MGVGSGDTAAQIATKAAAAITAMSSLALSAAVNGGTPTKVDLTAKHKGENGNYVDIRFNYYSDEAYPSGVTAAVVQMTGGAGNPNLSAVFTAIGDDWFTDFVIPYTDTSNIVAAEAEMLERFGPTRMIDGYCYLTYSDTHANLVTKGDSRNSPHLVSHGLKGSPTPPYEQSALWGGVCSYHLKLDPARPVQTLALPGLKAPAVKDRFTMEERNILLHHGIATTVVDAGGLVRIERAITNYRQSDFGASDPSFLDLETMKTLTYLRYDVRNYIALTYPRYKLADDGTNFARGQNVVTPSVIRGSLIARFRLWEEAGLVENIDQFKEDLIVERDKDDVNRINALIPPDIINQLRVFAGLVQFRL